MGMVSGCAGLAQICDAGIIAPSPITTAHFPTRGAFRQRIGSRGTYSVAVMLAKAEGNKCSNPR